VFSTGALPEEIPEHPGAGMTVIDFMTAYQFASSKGEAKRLVDQKAVKINEAPVTSWEVQLKTGDIIQVGPRKFGRVR
jgi:tyrosyl-tRNA synthetase